ncbi:MAG: 4Fe-4S dicluster domain-containing protein [Oscillospiraceae bacterium]|nr:4Fe-4S dicluster domain-containing protein [Oscillospiraceae bacterium]
MSQIQERGSTHVYIVNKISKEEIESMVERCVYEQPPFCNAACPLKLDTRSLLKAVADGDFKKALQLYEKIAPFPLILSQGCEAPCEAKCRLCERGDGIAIREIESAVARLGEQSRLGSVFRTGKKQKVAIFGSGLFALFLAGELEKKAYPLTVFCEEPDLESFLHCETEFLDPEAFSQELKRLKRKDIRFEFGCELTPDFFTDKRRDYQVVCASEKAARVFFTDAVCIPELMYFEEQNLVMGLGKGVMPAAFGAKKAALTVDRLAQKLDPRNTRGQEGSVESRLYTDLSEASQLCRVVCPEDGYTKNQAMEEAGRCIQCHCEECLRSCAYLKHYRKHPGLLAKEIYNNTQIIMGDHQLNKPMNSCSLCGQCTVVCPNGFDMAHVCHLARQNMVSTDKMPLAPHEFALLDMLFSNGDAFLARPQPGFEACRYVFFPGCQASAIAPATVRAAYEDLCSRLDGGVALMLGCCGAICDWAGRYEMQDQTVEFLNRELNKLGNPIIIAGCPSCRKELCGHTSLSVCGIWDILNEIGLPKGTEKLNRPMALHDSCGARGDARTQESIRRLAQGLGVELIETPYSGDRSPCCGYGGLTAYANPEVAGEMTDSCLERSDAAYLSYCMACRDRFARQGRESRHLLELVYGTDAGAPPDISEKRWNRLTLKKELLQELWGEDCMEDKLDFELNYTQDARRMMDERMILTDDVIAVLSDYRVSGEAVLDEESGLLVARRRVGNATFWVGFTQEGENAYLVHRAYSHRMQVVRREG